MGGVQRGKDECTLLWIFRKNIVQLLILNTFAFCFDRCRWGGYLKPFYCEWNMFHPSLLLICLESRFAVLAGWKSWAGQRCFHVDLSQRCFRCVDKDRLRPAEFTDEVSSLCYHACYRPPMFTKQCCFPCRFKLSWEGSEQLLDCLYFHSNTVFPFRQTIFSIFEQCQLSSPELYCCLRHWQRKFDCAELSSDSGRCN